MKNAVSEENLATLKALKKQGVKIAILTSRTLPEVKHFMRENHPLHAVLDGFYHRDNLQFLKPDPRVFNKALTDFQVTPQECVYIGDAVSDAVAAKGAGMHFIAVLESGLRKKEDFKNSNVDFFANTFSEILPYITTLIF